MFNPQSFGQMMPGYGFRNPLYQPPAAPQQTPPVQQMVVIPVTGIAQVEAAQAPFDGTPIFFYDTSADLIYIKQFDSSNGTAPVSTYRKEQKAPPPQYATVDMLAALSQKVDDLSAQITPRRAKKEADTE